MTHECIGQLLNYRLPLMKSRYSLWIYIYKHTHLYSDFTWWAYILYEKQITWRLNSTHGAPLKKKGPVHLFGLSLYFYFFLEAQGPLHGITGPGLKLYEWAFPSLTFGLILSKYIENYFAIINSFEWVFSEVAQMVRKGEYCNYWICTILKVPWSVLRLFLPSDFVSWNNFAQVNHLKLDCSL